MQKTVRTPVANLYRTHTFMSDQVSQALMGEVVDVLDKFESWYKIHQWDGYESWIHNFYLMDVVDSSADTYYFDRHTSQIICEDGKEIYIPFGVALPVEEMSGDFVKVKLPWGEIGKCFISSHPLNDDLADCIIANARKFNGVQYQWGGVTTFGCDCSGFVQTIFKSVGIKLPRDSHEQFDEKMRIKLEDAVHGDLLFFADKDKIDHVGISLGDSRIIHCSGFVREESLASLDKVFNKSLLGKFYMAMSMKALR